MSDETTGMITPEAEQTAGAGSPVATELSAPTNPIPANGTNSVATENGSLPTAPSASDSLGMTQTEEAVEDDLQQMPPLDEIEVPGTESDGRSTGSELRPGQVVKGTVVLIDHEGVLVDVRMKTEGLIRPNELSREPIQNMEDVVQIGDEIEVLVLEPESREGRPILSKKRADFEKAWDHVQQALKDGTILQAMVSERVRGGLVVDLGIRGFVPASHVGNGRLKNLDKFVGQSVPLKVLEVDRHNRKVVLSNRLATEEERERERKETLGSLGEGQVRTGTIRRVTDYGAFVDLGGIDGLLHVSEMSWTRVRHPSDVVKVGDQVQVMILKMTSDQGRISLGMRQILPDPWDSVPEQFHVGDIVEGEISRLVPFGAFVSLEGGIEGIIPNSELAWKRIGKPADVVEVGQSVQVKVIDVRAEERRLTLSLRQLQPRDEPQPETMAPPPPATDDASAGKRNRRDRRRGGDRPSEEGGGGEYRQYMRGDSGGGFTIGDMFPELAGRSSKAGKGKEKRRRRDEDEEEDFEELDDVDAEVTEDDPATEE